MEVPEFTKVPKILKFLKVPEVREILDLMKFFNLNVISIIWDFQEVPDV